MHSYKSCICPIFSLNFELPLWLLKVVNIETSNQARLQVKLYPDKTSIGKIIWWLILFGLIIESVTNDASCFGEDKFRRRTNVCYLIFLSLVSKYISISFLEQTKGTRVQNLCFRISLCEAQWFLQCYSSGPSGDGEIWTGV